METFDLIIIGGGPGGYSTAAAAAARGERVALVERDFLGGTCLNCGCIPTKVICHGADAGMAWADIAARRDSVVGALREGVAEELRSVTVVSGEASFPSPDEPRRIAVACADGSARELTAPHIVIATGSAPAALPIPGADLAMSSTELLSLPADASLPRSLAIIGGGVIGMEFASAFARLGVEVTVIEYCPEILPGIDPEAAKRLRMILRRRGIAFNTSSAATSISRADEAGPFTVTFTAKGKEKSVEADAVLMAVGRRPVLPPGIAEAGVELTPRGYIAVDPATMETSVPGIYAIGDVNGLCLLAHAAEAQGRRVLGIPVSLDTIPAVCFTSPAVATAGITDEAALRARGIEPLTATATFRSNGYAMAIDSPDGIAKIAADAATGRITGVTICGPGAADLIGEATLAVTTGLTLANMARAVHPHPTLSETLAAAARAALAAFKSAH